jgi:hypothetical protein
VLGVACRECLTRVARRTLGVIHSGQALVPRRVALVLDGEQGNSSTGKACKVALIELREGLVGNPLQSVVEVVAGGRGEPDRYNRVGGVSRDVRVDLAASTPKLTVWVATVRGSPHVVETVKHITE